jgi:methylenetetrahydrofolate dehydrogenase (NADP+) / methenyltetrahydrofolate cyclohydrolase
MIIKTNNIKNKIINEIKKEINQIILLKNRLPKLFILLIGNDYASQLYVKNKIILCRKVNILVEFVNLNSSVKEIEVISILEKANNNKDIDGILVQLPLPKHFKQDKICAMINSEKDVDCLHPLNFGIYMQTRSLKNDILLPCIVSSLKQIIDELKIKIECKNVLIINFSNLIGKPLLVMFKLLKANVTICEYDLKNISFFTKKADIICVAVGKFNFLKKEMIKKDVIIFDIGISFDLSNKKLSGDVDQEIYKFVKMITPVPGGIGPLTVVNLLKNLIFLYKKNNK